MKGLPAAIKDENGGWSTAYWYPHAPPTKGVIETYMHQNNYPGHTLV